MTMLSNFKDNIVIFINSCTYIYMYNNYQKIAVLFFCRVKNVLELQLNINIGGWTGRVHITELTDDVCQVSITTL